MNAQSKFYQDFWGWKRLAEYGMQPDELLTKQEWQILAGLPQRMEIDEDGMEYTEMTEEEWAVSEKFWKIMDWARNEYFGKLDSQKGIQSGASPNSKERVRYSLQEALAQLDLPYPGALPTEEEIIEELEREAERRRNRPPPSNTPILF